MVNFVKSAAVALVALTVTISINPAMAASCRDISMKTERLKFTQYLVRSGLKKSQVDFLTNGAVRRANELSKTGMNERGKSCGIAHVRASVLSCLNAIAPGSSLSLEKTGKSAWGRSNLTRGEMLIIGLFHTCRAGAMESFYSR
ncbi:MAG: hypothetical protein JNK47_02940 [Mesorhizobium sp.]|nr:hypothetical protein [Mesorhizobium sp.]MBL8576157.1 hypothetical protein [Mesorhizobium sp.]